MFHLTIYVMRFKLLFLLLFAFASTQVEAQSFLKKLGKTVEKTITKEVEKLTNKSNDNSSQPQKQTPTTSSASSARRTVSQPQVAVSTDKGENIPREAGLDYIDEYGVNHGGGILIGGILWAPVNCGYHATDYPYGKLYQWGRKHGQGYGAPYERPEHEVKPDKTTAEVVPAPVTPAEARKYPNRFYAKSDMASFNWTRNDMKLWNNFTDDGIIFKNQTNDPCPKGWRLPDLQDFNKLAEHYSDFTEHPVTGQKGRWFSGPNAYSTRVPRIFLPAAGGRGIQGGAAHRDKSASYWSLRHGGGEGLVWNLTFYDQKVEVTPYGWPHGGAPVRCVKDVQGQVMR